MFSTAPRHNLHFSASSTHTQFLPSLNFYRTQPSTFSAIVLLTPRSILRFRILQFCQLFICENTFVPFSTEIKSRIRNLNHLNIFILNDIFLSHLQADIFNLVLLAHSMKD